MKPDCQSCEQSMQGADLKRRCRINSLECTPANAEGCSSYAREAGSDDEPWYRGGWCVTTSTEGRGD